LEFDRNGGIEGTVRQVMPGRAVVDLEGGPVEAHLRGGLTQGRRNSVHLLAVGDRVRLRRSEGLLVLVEEILPRRNELARVDVGDKRGLRKQVLAANLDRICVVVSLDRPRYNPRGVDRFLVLAASAEVPALLVLNKCDLQAAADGRSHSSEGILDLYRSLGYEAIGTSTVTGAGLGDLRAALAGRLSFLLGPSGVGKSSLLNVIYGLDLRTTAISRATSKGVHTTARVDWVDLPGGGAVLDAPGIRSIPPWGLDRGSLAFCFPEFRRVGPCRFGDCLHCGEAGCAVEAAAGVDQIPAQRLDSYRRILETLPR
jgi:ribosome biogenesis GTPase / thiamine phosphate phosphatase